MPTFGTVALLRLLTNHSEYPEFTHERYRHDLRTLLKSYVVDLPITTDEITELAHTQDWTPAVAAAMFSRPHFWMIEPLRPRWAHIAEKVWENAPVQLAGWLRQAITGATAQHCWHHMNCSAAIIRMSWRNCRLSPAHTSCKRRTARIKPCKQLRQSVFKRGSRCKGADGFA